MLERTAASLEPCSFQRIIPSKSTPFKSNRRLHTTFWYHGAADIELSSVWQALVREPLDSLHLVPTAQANNDNKPESLRTSTLLLDFLYPQGAIQLSRRSSLPSILDRHDRSRSYFRGTAPRLFTSAASDRQKSTSQAPGDELKTEGDQVEDTEDVHPQESEEPPSSTDEATTSDLVEDVHAQDVQPQDNGEPTTTSDSAPDVEPSKGDGSLNVESTKKTSDQASQPKKEKAKGQLPKSKAAVAFEAAMDRLNQLTRVEHADEFEKIWTAYHAMKPNYQLDYEAHFFNYITKHRTRTQLFALALKREKHRFLVNIWKHLQMPQVDFRTEELDWTAFEELFTIDELGFAISSFIGQMKLQETRTKGPRWPEEVQQSLLYKMIYPLMRRYAEFFSKSSCVSMLVQLQNRDLYEHFLRLFIEKRNKDCADTVYQHYRELLGSSMSGGIMENMLHKIYFPNNGAGMELAARDLYARFRRLTPGQHRRLLMYYARQGDTASVERQWEKYEKQMLSERGEEWQPNPEEFSPLLHVYAVRGELISVRRIFTAIQGRYGPELNTQCWNILLNAHAKAQEYEAAVRVFNSMRQTVELDRHSFGTMMGMTGSRGDIEFTLDMYRMAKEQGIEHDITIIDSVVEVYCQNDRLADAQKICEIATTSGEYEPAALTTLWNTVLDHLAYQRDLVAMNRILSGMAQSQIPYDGETYEALLRGLALTKQASHAYYILKEAAKTNSFQPDLHHYALLMAAFIRTKRPQLALSMSNVLKMYGSPPRGQVLVRILQALGSWTSAIRKRDSNTGATRQFLVKALREFRTSVEHANRPRKQPTPINNPPTWLSKNKKDLGPDHTLLTVTRQARLLCFIFAQLREMATVQDILDMWRDSSPQASEMANPPLMLLSTLMLAAYNDRKFDEVESIWTIAFHDTKKHSQVPAPGTDRDKALPGMRYLLNDAVRIMLRMYSAQQATDKLKLVVSSFLDAGFHLDSKNWNYYVQMLASLKQWREAFVTCEERLMPHWLGWYSVIPLEMRRKRSNPRQPRPISFTMVTLSKAYMELEQMSVWSTEAERLLQYITENCPTTVTAINSQIREESNYLTSKIMSGREVHKASWGDRAHLELVARENTGTCKTKPIHKSTSTEDPPKEDLFAVGEDANDEWYDVDAQDDENWTPMTIDQKMKPSRKQETKRRKAQPDSEPWYDSEGNIVEGFDTSNTVQKSSF